MAVAHPEYLLLQVARYTYSTIPQQRASVRGSRCSRRAHSEVLTQYAVTHGEPSRQIGSAGSVLRLEALRLNWLTPLCPTARLGNLVLGLWRCDTEPSSSATAER
jgi:hypothetical protein